MNVLFLGGNRFVGKALAERFVSFGYNVTVFNRQGTGPKGVKVIQGDRNEKGSLSKIPFIDFDIVIDFCLFKHSSAQRLRSTMLLGRNSAFKSPRLSQTYQDPRFNC